VLLNFDRQLVESADSNCISIYVARREVVGLVEPAVTGSIKADRSYLQADSKSRGETKKVRPILGTAMNQWSLPMEVQ